MIDYRPDAAKRNEVISPVKTFASHSGGFHSDCPVERERCGPRADANADDSTMPVKTAAGRTSARASVERAWEKKAQLRPPHYAAH